MLFHGTLLAGVPEARNEAKEPRIALSLEIPIATGAIRASFQRKKVLLAVAEVLQNHTIQATVSFSDIHRLPMPGFARRTRGHGHVQPSDM